MFQVLLVSDVTVSTYILLHRRGFVMKQCHYKDHFLAHNSCVADLPVWDRSRASCTLLHERPKLCTRSLVAPCIVAMLSHTFVQCDLCGRGLHSVRPKYFYFDIPYNFICFGALIWNEHGWELYYSHMFYLLSASDDISIESHVHNRYYYACDFKSLVVINRHAYTFSQFPRRIPGKWKLQFQLLERPY